MGLVETIVERWQEQDPYLLRPQEFEKFFEIEYAKELKKAEREVERQLKLLVRAIAAPIILWKGAWMDSVPKWLLDYIQIDRMITLMKDGYDGMATDAEALAYMMPRTLEAPMYHEWVKIYCYLATKVMKQAKGAIVPKDVAVEELDKYEQQELNMLKRWIWERQDKALRERRRKRKQSINSESSKFKGGGKVG